MDACGTRRIIYSQSPSTQKTSGVRFRTGFPNKRAYISGTVMAAAMISAIPTKVEAHRGYIHSHTCRSGGGTRHIFPYLKKTSDFLPGDVIPGVSRSRPLTEGTGDCEKPYNGNPDAKKTSVFSFCLDKTHTNKRDGDGGGGP